MDAIYANKEMIDWDYLLDCIEERMVVPIVGAELLFLNLDGRTQKLDQLLAKKMLSSFQLSSKGMPDDYGVSEAACKCVQAGIADHKIYSRLNTIFKETPLTPTESLLKLAAISGFNLFVSTTPDDLLLQALNSVRFNEQALTQTFAFSPRRHGQDLPPHFMQSSQTAVFQLFGRIGPAADYALMEKDLLEFMRMLQSPNDRPEILFDTLRDNHILMLGCSFPGWLARFFLDLITDVWNPPRRLSKMVADDNTYEDNRLTLFMRQCHVDIYQPSGTLTFVDELHQRWMERYPEGTRGSISTKEVREAVQDDSQAIFISYSSNDLTNAMRIKQALEGIGWTVWLDKNELKGGDLYSQKIRRNIQQCAIFMPIVSQSAASRIEGFFRREWRWAIERSEQIDETYAFIIPIAVDSIAYDTPGIPDHFHTRHWRSLVNGEPSTEFLDSMKQRLRDLRQKEAGR